MLLTDQLQNGGSSNLLFGNSVQMPVANSGCHLYFWPIRYKSGVLKIPSVDSSRNILLTRSLVYCKRTSGTARWKRWIGQDRREEFGSSCSFHVQHPSQISKRSPTWKFSKPGFSGFYGGVLTQEWLIKSLAVSSPLPLPWWLERPTFYSYG